MIQSHEAMIFDAHTHLMPEFPGQAVVNLEYGSTVPSDDGWYSVGLHPWNADSELDECHLENVLSKPNVLALGECGLDALRGPSMDIQVDRFERQIRLACSLNKPVILHVVKKYDHIIRMFKVLKPTRPWLIHGFRGGPEQMRQLFDLGLYVSLGKNADSQTMKEIPQERLILETDGKCPIEEVQMLAANLKDLEISEIREISSRNAQDFFLGSCHVR